MSLTTLLRHVVTISRYTATGSFDAYGQVVASWVDDLTTTKAFVQPGGKTDVVADRGRSSSDARDTVVADYVCFFMPTVSVSNKDRIKWGSHILQVITTEEAQRPGKQHHLKTLLREVDG